MVAKPRSGQLIRQNEAAVRTFASSNGHLCQNVYYEIVRRWIKRLPTLRFPVPRGNCPFGLSGVVDADPPPGSASFFFPIAPVPPPAPPARPSRRSLRRGQLTTLELNRGVYDTLLPGQCVSLAPSEHPPLVALRARKMANFLRSATIVLMGATVMAAGIFVAIYS